LLRCTVGHSRWKYQRQRSNPPNEGILEFREQIMSVVQFNRQRVRKQDMPPLCLRCGAAATVTVDKTFSKSQGWTTLLWFVGGPPAVFLGALIFRNRLQVPVPMCDRHRNHFRWQTRLFWGGLAASTIVFAMGLALLSVMPANREAWAMAPFGTFFGLWLLAYMVSSFTGITAATVDDNEAVVVGVSPRFVSAYPMLPDTDPDVEPAPAYASGIDDPLQFSIKR
jgi:hypothetical protein